MTFGSYGMPPFEVAINGSVGSRYQDPAAFAFPLRRGDNGFEVVDEIEYLRSRHERGPLRSQVDCEVLMKLRGIEVRETVGGLLYSTRLAEVTWEALSVARFIFYNVWHVGRDVHQSRDR